MISFCPTCANMLMVDDGGGVGELRLFCECCPYYYKVDRTIIKEAKLTRKEVEAVHDEDDANKTRQKTDASPCPMCGHKIAYFYEMQTRSADEPATIFFECEKCKHQWKEG